MFFVSVTRLRLKSFFSLLSFMRANEASIKDLKRTPGFIEGRELVDKNLTFWTLTIWEADANMKQFRNGEAHKKAMRKLPDWCDEASYAHWTQEDKTLPDWEKAYDIMMLDGKATKVRHPSENQLTKSYPRIKWTKTGRPLLPNG